MNCKNTRLFAEDEEEVHRVNQVKGYHLTSRHSIRTSWLMWSPKFLVTPPAIACRETFPLTSTRRDGQESGGGQRFEEESKELAELEAIQERAMEQS